MCGVPSHSKRRHPAEDESPPNLGEGEASFAIRQVDLLNGVHIGCCAKVQPKVVLHGSAHDLLQREGREKRRCDELCHSYRHPPNRARKRGCTKECHRHKIFYLPWLIAPWCNRDQNAQCPSLMHPAHRKTCVNALPRCD